MDTQQVQYEFDLGLTQNIPDWASGLADSLSYALRTLGLGTNTGARYLGLSRGNTSLAEAITSIGSSEVVLVVPPGTWEAGGVTIPSNIHLKVLRGAIFTIANATTLTINGPFEAGRYKVFNVTGTGKVSFSTSGLQASVYPEWWGAVADWNPSTKSGTDDVTALEAACAAHSVVDLGDRDYTVESTLNITSDVTFISNGATIHYENSGSGDQPEVIRAEGLVGTYYSLASNALEGTNVIEQSTLAGLVSPGDLLMIKSSKEVVASAGYWIGEMQTVLKVSGNYIYLSGALHDTYNTSDTAQAAIVSPIQFDVRGCLKVRQYPVSDSQVTNGVDIRFSKGTYGRFEVYDCTYLSLAFRSCFAPNIDFYSNNSHYSSTGTSYGVCCDAATMNAVITGFVHGARHAYKCGTLTGWYGRAWNIKFRNCIGYGLHEAGIFDAHEIAGSVYFENCIAIGGEVNNKDTGTDRPDGFSVGARENYIRNCTYIGEGSAVLTRPSTPHIQVIEIDGLYIKNTDTTQKSATLSISDPNQNTVIDTVIVRNVRGNPGGGLFITGDSTYTTTINEIVFENVHLKNSAKLLYLPDSSNKLTLPSTVDLTNCSAVGDNTTACIYLTGSTTPFSVLRLNNVTMDGSTYPIYLVGSLTRLELNNVHSSNPVNGYHVYFTAGDLDELVIIGGHFADGTTAVARLNKVSGVLGKLTVIGTKIEDSPRIVYLADSGAVLNSAYLGPIDANLTSGISNRFASSYIEYLAGCPSRPFVIRGSGTPESVVTAPIGSMFLRSDGGTSTTMYIKESGTGSTGWVAK